MAVCAHRADRFLDDRDNRFLEEFQQPHARTVAEQQPAGRRVVTLDDADRQLRGSKGQLRLPCRLPVIRASNELLCAIDHGGYESVRRGTFRGLTQRASIPPSSDRAIG
jgi:hypothetical protein